jgi:hypothetical protein
MSAAFPEELQTTPEQAYSSLSIMALIGFGIAALHAAAIVLMAIVGLFNQTPLLLSVWTLLVPLSAILLCLIARNRIRSSEGTLAGETLTRWGLLLTLFTGLGYWSYYTAVFFAVRQQARAYAEDWLDRLREGDTVRAAMSALPPLKRLGLNDIKDESELAAEVEQRILGLEGPRKTEKQPASMLNTFNQLPLVRQLAQGGKETNLVLKGVVSWSYVRGGYEVVLLYDLEMPDATVEATITARGQTAPQNEYEQRQWYIDMKQSHLHEQDLMRRMTEQGRVMARIGGQSGEFLGKWQNEITGTERQGAFLLSLPAEQREQAKKAIEKAAPLAALAGSFGATTALPEGVTLEKLAQFCDGKPMEIDGRFRLPDNERQELLADMRKLFTQDDSRLRFMPSQSLPLRTRSKDKLLFKHDVQIGVPSGYLVEAVAEIECDAKALDSPKVEPNWRFVTLRLVSAKKVGKQ